LEWRNRATYIDNFFFDNEYPRTTGYVLLNNPANHPAGTELVGASGWEYRNIPGTPQHIFFEGGMNPTPNNEDGKLSSEYPDKGNSNIYDPETFRESNLYAVGELGNTVEFWWKRERNENAGPPGIIDPGSECLFDMWNNVPFADPDYGRIVIEHWNEDWDITGNGFARFTVLSKGSGVERLEVGTAGTLPTDFDPDEWNHYAFTYINTDNDLLVKFHINGQLIEEITTPAAAIDAIDWVATFPMTARIGAYQTEPIQTDDGDFGVGTYGSLQGSIDEFRFWKKARTSKEVGRYWFTQFGGGTNTDEANTSLGVYYKFNEGIVNTTEVVNVDANVLDYSGRLTNATILNYDLGVRSVSSAIDESGANNIEFKDPIMYPFHPDVSSLKELKKKEGYEYDIINSSSIFNSIPDWIVDEARNSNSGEIINLVQMVSNYFDTLHLQIEALPSIGDAGYIRPGEKPLPFAKHLLESKGLVAPDIFVDSTVLESLVNRTEDRTYEQDVSDIKNEIYQNIYNNLAGIYKAKGTEKSFRNMMRCFGIGDKLVKINLYGDGVKFRFEDYYRSASVKKSYVNFNNPDRFDGTIKQLADPAIPDSKSFIAGGFSPDLTYIPITMESEVVFPKKLPVDHPDFFRTPFTTVSLFGLHNINSAVSIDTWIDSGFAVYAEKREEESSEIRFRLKPYGFAGLADDIVTDYFKDVYDNEKWNIAVRVRPTVSILDLVENASTGIIDPQYVIEFYGVNMVLDIVQGEFSEVRSLDIVAAEAFLNADKRTYVGAEYTNFTTLAERSDAKISSTRVWLDYLDDDTIKSHAKDVENYGTKNPYKEAYFSQTSVEDIRVPQAETLLLHWDFETVGATDGSGEFIVNDIAYGPADGRYGAVLGDILGYQYTGLGEDFFADDKKVTDKTYVASAKQQLPEMISSNSTINILTQDDDVFTKESEPINYFWAIEKSMYQTISDEMIDMFASISSFNNLVGEPVNKYRTEYKDLTKLRQLFFERIENEPDIEKYIEFYKWIDTAVNQMIQQLIPASANFSEDMRTMIESHVLERSKYRNKYQYFGPRKDEDPIPLLGINEMLYNWKQGHASVREDEHCLWWNRRARRDEAPLATGDAEVDADRQQTFEVSTRVNSGSWEGRSLAYGSDTKNMTEYQGQTFALRSLSQPYRFKVDDQPVTKSGTNVYRNKKKDYVKVETQPFSGTQVTVAEAPDHANSTCVDDDDRNALKKEKKAFKAANQKYQKGSYENEAKGLVLSPVDLYQNITNDEFYWSNLHDDSYGEDKETPMQGPFTQAHVGGSPHRHVPINEVDRPEAWEFTTTGATGTFSEPSDYRAKFYRDETAKRHVNIRNIKFGLDDAIHGNYRFDYEIIQTSSRRLNNVWFVRQQGVLPGASASIQSDAVYGHYDFDLPNRGRNAHVFVERFSAPGSADTLARGMTDVESEEFSPYNALPFRNLDVRVKLNRWLTFHSKFGGLSSACDDPTEDFPCAPSFHKVQRNGRELPSGEGNDFQCIEKYDNFWKTEMIPATEYGYSWINDSVDDILAFDNIIGEPSFCKTGYITEKDEMLNASVYKPPVIVDPYSSKYGDYYTIEDVADSAGELEFEQGLPFVNNFQSYEGVRHPRTFDEINIIDTDSETATPEVTSGTLSIGTSLEGDFIWRRLRDGRLSLNEILNNRGDVFTYPTWKQIRNTDNKAVSLMRRNNTISIEEKPKLKTIETDTSKSTLLSNPSANKKTIITIKPKRERLAQMYVEPSLSWNRPLQHRLQFRGGSAAAKITYPYSNNLELFSNPFINKRLGLRNKSRQLYDIVLEQYITDDNRYSPKFFELKYEEYIYPKHRNATLKRTRLRSSYEEGRGFSPNGYDRRSSEIRKFWKDDIRQRQRSVYVGTNSSSTAKNALGYQVRNSSVWVLDYFKYIGGNDTTQIMRGDLAWAGYSQFRGYVYEPSETSEILTWFDEELNGESQTWIAPRPTLQFIHNPNSQKAREEGWAWKTGELSGNKPWYNSYDDFSVDVKLIGQNYSIVPEYNISEHMDFYVNERGGNFRAENKKIFQIVGNDTTINNGGVLNSTTESYYSYDGIIEVEQYKSEPNYAQGYENLALGKMLGTQNADINLVCPQEPPGDIDSNIRNWRCAEPYPVALLNKYFIEGTPQFMITGFNEFSTTTVTFKSEAPAYTDDDTPYTSEEAWSDNGQDKVPVGFAPIPYYNTVYTDPAIKGSTADIEGDKEVFWDQWENTFLVSFWMNLDSQIINSEYIDEDGTSMKKSIGAFSMKGGEDYINADFVLDQTPVQIKTFLDSNGDPNNISDAELAIWIASFFTVLNSQGIEFDVITAGLDIDNDGDIDLDDQQLLSYSYYLLYREQLALFDSINDFIGTTDQSQWPLPSPQNDPGLNNGIIRWLQINNLLQDLSFVYKTSPTTANFYLSDHKDDGGNVKYRPSWVDNLGNKIFFNIEFGQTTAYALDQWHHVSLLYVGGSQTEDLAAPGIDYDSRHHRVFLWVNNQQISSEIYDVGTDLDALAIPGVVNEQKYNGTLFMRNARVGNLGIDSLAESPFSFTFGKCDFSQSLDPDTTLEYEIPQATLPGKVTDLLFIRGGEIGIEPRSNLAQQCDVVTEDELNHPSYSLSYRWFFDNTLPGFVSQNMNSSLVKLLSNSQCEDQNQVLQSWRDEFCTTSTSLGGSQFDLNIGGNSNTFDEDDSFIPTEADITNCPILLGWWKMGIPKFDKQTFEAQVWREDFFKNYSHTDQLIHLEKISSDHKSLGPGASKVLRLEVDTVKKLLPYNGFYPSQRATQIGSLFYDSVAPFVEGVNDEQQWERARTEQALLQPFFSPGILFNTIKSGIAVDWAAYSGDYKVDGSVITIRDEYLGEFVINEGSSEQGGAGAPPFGQFSTGGSNAGNNAGGAGQGYNSQGNSNSISGSNQNPFSNTQTMEAIMKKAKDALKRDVLLGVVEQKNINSIFGSYYKKALEDTKSIYERLAKKLERAVSSRDYEIWAEDRQLDPYSEESQEQYRAIKVRDVDWKYNPQYAASFPTKLKSLVDKSYNKGQGNEIKEVQSVILDTIDKITKFPDAKLLTVQYKKNPAFKVGGSLKYSKNTQTLINQSGSWGKNGKPSPNNLSGCTPIPSDGIDPGTEGVVWCPPPWEGDDDGGTTTPIGNIPNLCIDCTGFTQQQINEANSFGGCCPEQNGQLTIPKPKPIIDFPGGKPSFTNILDGGKAGFIPFPNPGQNPDPGGGGSGSGGEPGCIEEEQGQEEEALDDILNILEGTYLNLPPNFRIPFEGLVALDSVLPLKDSDEASKVFFLAPSYYTSSDLGSSVGDESQNRYPYFEWTGRKNALYELAMNNFLAEIPNFFLKAKQFTTFASKPEKEFKTVEQGKTYYMDVHLYKTENFAMTISPYDGETVFVNRFGDGLEEPAETYLDGDGNPYTTQGRYFGPAVRYKTLDSNNEDVFYIGDPAQAPYVPPYFYGRAKARISFTPDFDGKPTLDQVLNKLDIEYINEEMDYLFASKASTGIPSDETVLVGTETQDQSWKNVPAYEGRMPIESSINFFGKTKQRNVLYDVVDTGFQFNAEDETKNKFIARTAEDTVDGASVWAISPRFECPTLNFDTIENKATRVYETPLQIDPENDGESLELKQFKPNLEKGEFPNIADNGRDIYGAVPRDPRGTGMWSGYGFIPGKERGIFMSLEESYKRRKDISTPLKCEFDEQETGVQKVLISIDTDTKLFQSRHAITLEDIYGITNTISIGPPRNVPPQNIIPKDTPLPGEQELLNLSTSGVELYEKTGQEPDVQPKKIRTILTSSESTIQGPLDGMAGEFDVEGYFGQPFFITDPDAQAALELGIPDASDIANAICYHTNYLYNTDEEFAWVANIRWISPNDSEVVGEASEFEKTFNLKDSDFVGYGAVVEFQWRPKLSNPIYQGKDQILDRCQVDLVAASAPLALAYVTEELLQPDTNVDINKQEDRDFYLDSSGLQLVNCEEVGSLIDVCGFQTSRSRIGDVADEKEISEAVVMIPFVDEPVKGSTKAKTVEVMGRNFFKISKNLFNFTKSNVDAGKVAIPRESTYNVEEDIEETTVSDMIKKMQRYNIPPMLDFITYPLKKGEFPFVMYIFEFTETLDKNDLSNVWQGVMPQIATTATKETQVIEHELNKINFFEGKELPENVRWMVFRVKRKANINYFKVTADSQDDDRFKFNFDVGLKAPEYSYNWPYDFCSLVEMARVRGGVSVLPPAQKILAQAVPPIKKDKLEDITLATVESEFVDKTSPKTLLDWKDTKDDS
jgi:hypothetical protein